MGRAATITLDQVKAICERLRAKGVRPTVRLVQSEHGSGSTSTIVTLLRQAEGDPHPPGLSPPAPSQALLRALSDQLAQQVAQARRELEQQLAESEQVVNDLARDNQQQEIELGQQAAAIDDLKERLASAVGQLVQLQSDHAELQHALREAQRDGQDARTSLTKAHLQLDRLPALETDVKNTAELLVQERAARSTAQQAAAVAQTQSQQLLERLEEARVRLGQLERRNDQTQAECLALAAELSEARLTQQLAMTRATLAEAERDAQRGNPAGTGTSGTEQGPSHAALQPSGRKRTRRT